MLGVFSPWPVSSIHLVPIFILLFLSLFHYLSLGCAYDITMVNQQQVPLYPAFTAHGPWIGVQGALGTFVIAFIFLILKMVHLWLPLTWLDPMFSTKVTRLKPVHFTGNCCPLLPLTNMVAVDMSSCLFIAISPARHFTTTFSFMVTWFSRSPPMTLKAELRLSLIYLSLLWGITLHSSAPLKHLLNSS